MTRIILSSMGVLALAACGAWDNLPHQHDNSWNQALWDADVTATADGVYVRLPGGEASVSAAEDTGWYEDYYYYADSSRPLGKLVRITDAGQEDKQVQEVNLGQAGATRIEVAPDNATALVFARQPACDTKDEDIQTMEECLEEGDSIEWNSKLHIVRDGASEASLDLPPHLNAISFDESSQFAVAFMDTSNPVQVDPGSLANVSAIQLIDLANPETGLTSINVGYGVERVLFTDGGSKAVVLSESKVVVIGLNGEDGPNVQVTYHLALDVDDDIRPKDADLTPDGSTAFLTVEGSGDLYALDLEAESINIVDLDASPADMIINDQADRTALVYASRAQVDLLDHDLMEVETIELDEPASDMIEFQTSGHALLYNSLSSSYKDVYKVDLTTGDIQEWRLKSAPTHLVITEDESLAVVFTNTTSNGNYGVEILNLTSESGASTNLESPNKPIGLALTEQHALILLEGVNDLLQVNLANGSTTAIELEDSPLGIGSYGSDKFWITHDAALGLVSFLDPSNPDDLVSVAGFASTGLFSQETPLAGQED
ncbi:MAG: hypothetical protein VX519_03065 [Myxococcota bacterium]|nr:hypothetical protein [Myxococcota bacterium]